MAKMSDAMRIDAMVKQMQSEGQKIINCSAGDPTMDPPGSFLAGIRNALINFNNCHNYGPAQGTVELREALYKYRNVPKETTILIGNGAKQLIFTAVKTVIDASIRKEIIVIGPCWSSYIDIIEACGGTPVLVLPTEEDRYYVTLDEIAAAWTPQTTAIIFNNPNNPTGYIYSAEQVNELVTFCEDNYLLLIADEIYKDIVYDNITFPATPVSDNVLVIDGFSKTFAITGWRMGYAYSVNHDLMKLMIDLQSQISGPPNTLIQHICADGLKNLPSSYIPYMLKQYTYKRNLIIQELEKYPYLTYQIPQGGFYFYINMGNHNENTGKICKRLLQKYGVAVTPGDSYGMKHHIRISFSAVDNKDLAKVIESIARVY